MPGDFHAHWRVLLSRERGAIAFDSLELDLSFAQLRGSLPNRVLKGGELHVELEMEPTRLKQIRHSQKDLELIERFEQKIGRARP
jgi:hypothetical protein